MPPTFYSTLPRLSPNLPFNEHLFQALLLAVIADEKHLLIRTPEEDVAGVLKSTVNVSFPCSGLL